MKRIVLAAIAISITMSSFAQTDSTGSKSDTIKIGGMIIIKKDGKDSTEKKERNVMISNRKNKSASKVSTNWGIVDVGFANYSDNSNYNTAAATGFTGPGIGKDQMKLRTGKSVNVNIWMFMQRISIIKRYVNLKYGLGVELNNYRFDDERITFQKNPTKIVLNTATAPVVDKNKLAADYVTMPMMLNFNFTPGRKQGFGFSAGVSAGYLYSARQKFKFSDDKKTKLHDDFNLEKWKISYVAELSLGPVRLYGSMATKTMWEKGLDQKPYNIGLRFSNF